MPGVEPSLQKQPPDHVSSVFSVGLPPPSTLEEVPYFLTILGVWKILGVLTVLIPKFPLLKEWAYPGFFFAMSGASFSRIALGDSVNELFPSLLLLILTVLSWYFRPADRKIISANFNYEQNKLDEIPALKIAFDELTPGRQRAYNLYFSAPKQAKTRESRVEKCMQQILDGKGLND